ncbi:hypothetical protein M2282_004706 [Variovorax boronicumulans]|uniref:DUF4123 domain-containing protein n=1 Tax=Variovorax boronicumulans TaxID=436515 RepID=UPI002476EA90|nr:DUF4123 domain-containing protein [Variovorax boronicumulans]MDH6169538.1 hypothetical protein [Variovorax boronicumulans]
MIDGVGAEGRAANGEELLNALIQGWNALTVLPSRESADARKREKEALPQRAYLVFNRWDGNPLARELCEQFPKWARDRINVPDSYFEYREERAPCLLELPEELVVSIPGLKIRDVRAWLAHCLEVASQRANERVTKQDFCGVVISPESEQKIVRHWVGLGDQRPPGSEDSVLFRYHDPRVMQRVWPALSPLQQSRWLGPVTQWWSLMQPWGPLRDRPEPAQWFRAKAPVLPCGAQAGGSPRDLLDEAQWFLSGISPDANSIWRSYAKHDVPPDAQPDPESLQQMLADAARMNLKNIDLEDYVWITWMHAPKEGPARAMDWSLPHLAPTLNRIEDQLRDRPDASFSMLLNETIQPQKR